MCRLLVCFLLLLFPVLCEFSRILSVFPTPSLSHQIVFRKYTDALASKGHKISVFTTDARENINKNITEIDLHDVSYKFWTDNYVKGNKGVKYSPDDFIETMHTTSAKLFELQMKYAKMKKLLEDNSTAYDLYVFEAPIKNAIGFTHIFAAPVIGFSSFHPLVEESSYIGAPNHVFYYPNPGLPVNKNSIIEKIWKTYLYFKLRIIERRIENLENDIQRTIFGNNSPTIEDLNKNVDLLFVNVNRMFEGNRPMPPNVVHLGGLHLESVKELPKDLKQYLDDSKNGVIYMSLGNNVKLSQLPKKSVDLFLNVFADLPYDVFMKCDDICFELPKNVRCMKYFPQRDLLNHPKVKLFITQGGLQSSDEAITAQVPMIAVPAVADQFFNAEKIEKFGIGAKLDFDTLTEDKLKNAIEEVMSDESYRHNIRRLDALYRDQQQTPIDRAIWWTEYLLRHKGAKWFRTPLADISWYNYFLIDVVLLPFGFFGVLMILLFIVMKIILNSGLGVKKIKN